MTNKQKIVTSDMGKDSDFSDTSSGYLSGVDQAEYKDILFSSPSAKNMQSCPEEPVVHGYYQGVSSMFLMDNVLLQQSNSKTPTLKPWGYKSQEVVSPSPLVLFQPVIPSGNCTYQTPTTEQRQFKNVTALNSSLNIASLTAHGDTEDRSHGHDGRHCQHRHGEKRSISKSSSTSNTSPDYFKHSTENVDGENCALHTPGFTSSESSLSLDSDNGSEAFSPCSSKRKRFCNTYNILNQSGLLGITLRTKELIQENQRSQAQLQKLHAHTDLFLEALRSEDPQVWTKLQLMFKNSTAEE